MPRLLSILLCAGLLLEGIFLLLARKQDLRSYLPEVIGLYVAATVFYLVASWIVLKIASPEAGWGGRGKAVILGFALLFRLTLWPLFPALSDDPFRYRWEGKLQAAGGNPYEARPADEAWRGLRDEAYERVVGKEVRGGYGPLTELLELGAWKVISRWEADPLRQVFWFKFPYAICDLGVMAALIWLLRARRLPWERVVVWAWCPLVVIEFWATGHNDSLALLFVVLALALAARKKWNLAFLALGAGIAAKLWPVVLLPVFIGWEAGKPARWRKVALAGVLPALCALPYWTNVTENVAFVTGFLSGWRNNDALFGAVLWLSGDVYAAKRVALLIVGAAGIWVALRRWPLEKGCLAVLVTLLLVSANCHVWYLTWLVPLLAVVPYPGLFLWIGLMPLAYEVLLRWVTLGEWEGSTPHRWYIHAPFLAWLAASAGRAIRSAALRRGPAAPPAPTAAAR